MENSHKYAGRKVSPSSSIIPESVRADGSETAPIIEVPMNVEVVANRIYFYNAIDSDTVLKLNKAIREVTNRLMGFGVSNDISDLRIYLHINSPGGEIHDSFAAADTVASNPVPVITIAEGIVASGATLLFLSGKRRLINKHAYILLHQISSEFWGKYEDFKDELQNFDEMMKVFRTYYKEHTKIPVKKINEILKHELLFNANQCINYGLADEII